MIPKNFCAKDAEKCLQEAVYLPAKVTIRRNEACPRIEAILRLLEVSEKEKPKVLFAEPPDFGEFMIAVKPVPEYWDWVKGYFEELKQQNAGDWIWTVKHVQTIGVVIRPFSEGLAAETFIDLLKRIALFNRSFIPDAVWVSQYQNEQYGILGIQDDTRGILDFCNPYEQYLGLWLERKWLYDRPSESLLNSLIELFERISPNKPIFESMFTFPPHLGTAMLYG